MHTDFWITVATVAPVVILSCVVLCSTQGGNLVALLRDRNQHRRAGTWVIVALISAAALNLAVFAVETIEFLDALQHLALGTDGGRGHVVFGQMWCLILLGVATVATHVARCSWGARESAETPASAAERSAVS